MEPQAADLTAIALIASIAVVFGLLLSKLRQPAIVGYVLAGLALGPSGAALVKSTGEVQTLAELGVILLLFVLGTELNVRFFLTQLGVALGCAFLQIAFSVAAAFGVGWLLDWPLAQTVLIGFLLSLSSTAVAVKMLEDLGDLDSDYGHLTVGALVAQDLAVVPMLLVLPALGGRMAFDYRFLAQIGLALLLLGGTIWFLARQGRFALPLAGWFRDDTDLAPLAILALCFSAASLSGLLGLTTAYGAFLAGLVLGNSTVQAATIRLIHPIQNVLLVVFFLSIGLLIDLQFVWRHLGTIAALLAAVVLTKTVINVLALRLLGQPFPRALAAGAVMAQIGEFSFVLAAAGLGARAIDKTGYRLAIAVIALSLVISPLWLGLARRFPGIALGSVNGLRNAWYLSRKRGKQP
jgi:CPA2 family monovalent cation:H+ antiporter-2